MWKSEQSTLQAAKQSSQARDSGGFIIVYYPNLDGYAYYLDEENAKKLGPPEKFKIVSKYKKKLLGYAKVANP